NLNTNLNINTNNINTNIMNTNNSISQQLLPNSLQNISGNNSIISNTLNNNNSVIVNKRAHLNTFSKPPLPFHRSNVMYYTLYNLFYVINFFFFQLYNRI